MVNFLIFTGIGPTKYFFGCFPLSIGMFVLFLLQVGFITVDILEHQTLFENHLVKDLVMNLWVTMSIQIVIALISVVAVFWKNSFYSVIVYFVLVGAAACTAAEKIFKVIQINKNFSVLGKPNSTALTLAFIYAGRSALEFYFYFYTAYIAYSYSSELMEKPYVKKQNSLI